MPRVGRRPKTLEVGALEAPIRSYLKSEPSEIRGCGAARRQQERRQCGRSARRRVRSHLRANRKPACWATLSFSKSMMQGAVLFLFEKSKEKQNLRLKTGSSAGQRALFVPGCLPSKTFLCKACPGTSRTRGAFHSWMQTGSRLHGPLCKLGMPLQIPVQARTKEFQPVESKTRTHNGRVESARRRADGGAGRRWAEHGADISVALEANRPSGPPAHCKQLF